MKKKIYLAGGLKSNWQMGVIGRFPQYQFFNPREHKLLEPKDYIKWDLDHISVSDIIFAYLEKDNPSGIGLAIEIGYAFCKGIPIILINEKKEQKWNMLNECCEFFTTEFDAGLNYLLEI